jgi:hypothetical protein
MSTQKKTAKPAEETTERKKILGMTLLLFGLCLLAVHCFHSRRHCWQEGSVKVCNYAMTPQEVQADYEKAVKHDH